MQIKPCRPFYHIPFTTDEPPAMLPTDGLLFNYDASLGVLGTSYANNALLPNQAGATGYDFKSELSGVTAPIVATNNSKQGLHLSQGDSIYTWSWLRSVSRITPETEPITFIVVASVSATNKAWVAGLTSNPRGAIRRSHWSNLSQLWNYSTNADFADTASTNTECFLVELPANTDTEPKTVLSNKNGSNIITNTNTTDFNYTTFGSQNFIIKADVFNSSGTYLHEFAIWHRRLTGQEKVDAFSYLMSKWGIV